MLATGVVDIEPPLPNLRDAIRDGLARHCPICDGYEVRGRRVAVLGQGSKGVREARFIRHFTDALTLFSLASDGISDAGRAELAAAGIALVEVPIPGVYACGDIVHDSLDQIAVAAGHAAIAATAIDNSL